MIDVERLIQDKDCRHIVEQDLGRPVSRGTAWMFKCPLHGERRGASLAVWENGWKCFGKCQSGGTVIDWVMKYRGLSFKDACHVLGGRDVPSARRYLPMVTPKAALSEPPSETWQLAAYQVIKLGIETLAAPVGERARQWLIARGITRQAQRRVMLGYLPGKPTDWHDFGELRIPSGILIPWIADGAIWGIKVRLAGGDVKYMQASGGNIASSLYRATPVNKNDWGGIIPNVPVIFVEGEFDALLVECLAGDLCCPVTLGSASGRLNVRWLSKLLATPVTIIMTDNDDAGDRAAQHLSEVLPNPVRVKLPYKDITDFWLADQRAARQFLVGLLKEAQEVKEVQALCV